MIADQLLGNKIKALFLSNDQTHLTFHFHYKNVAKLTKSEFFKRTLKTTSDCCSETWFADIVGVDNLINGTINSIEFIKIDSVNDGRTRQESDMFYGFNLKTEKGVCQFVYRNSSNGFYGGSLEIEYHNHTTDIQITNDYSA